MTADAGAVRVADNDALVEWLHVHAEHLDNPIDVGVVRAAADEITGIDGKQYAAKSDKREPRRTPLVDDVCEQTPDERWWAGGRWHYPERAS